MCKLGKSCKNKLCSYKHNFENNEIVENLHIEDEPDVEIMVENELLFA